MSVGFPTFSQCGFLFVRWTEIFDFCIYFVFNNIFMARKIQSLHDREARILKAREFPTREAKRHLRKSIQEKEKEYFSLIF